MELNRSKSVTVDKVLVICKLHEIVDYYLLGDGTWPLDRESLQAFWKTVRDLGLDEAVAGQPGTTRFTVLGKELKLDLIMAFVGAWDMWEIPSILEEHTDISTRLKQRPCSPFHCSRVSAGSNGWCFEHTSSFVTALPMSKLNVEECLFQRN